MQRGYKSAQDYTAHDDMTYVKVPAPGLPHNRCSLHVEGTTNSLWAVCLWVDRESPFILVPPPGFLRLDMSLRIFLVVSFLSFAVKASAWAFDRTAVSTRVQTGNK